MLDFLEGNSLERDDVCYFFGKTIWECAQTGSSLEYCAKRLRYGLGVKGYEVEQEELETLLALMYAPAQQANALIDSIFYQREQPIGETSGTN